MNCFRTGLLCLLLGSALTATAYAAPTVLVTDPTDGETQVALTRTVSATFSEAMDASTINETSFTVNSLSGTVTYDTVAFRATFTPAAALTQATQYTATLATSISSALGVPLVGSVAWSFTTVNGAPTVATVVPPAGATDVPIGISIAAVFSQPMDPATITAGTFLLSGISGTVTYDTTTFTALFTPQSALRQNTTFTATVTTGAADAAGQPLAANYTWTFTTETSSGGLCFIATAAFGSPLAGQIRILSRFRDRCLMTNTPGRRFVAWYYRHGPAAADYIRPRPVLRALVRAALYPLILLAWLSLCGVLPYLLFVACGCALWRLRNRSEPADKAGVR